MMKYMARMMCSGSWLMQPLHGVLNASFDLLSRYANGDPSVIMVDADIFNKYWRSAAMGERQQTLAERQALEGESEMRLGWKKYGADESLIIGKTPVKISVSDDVIHMKFSDGSEAKWLHNQDCCESVTITDVNGDWSDLVGHPLLVCEARTNSEDDPPEYHESFTWTFYTYRSIGGSVDVRWLGESNGYYSEGVDFHYKEANNAL